MGRGYPWSHDCLAHHNVSNRTIKKLVKQALLSAPLESKGSITTIQAKSSAPVALSQAAEPSPPAFPSINNLPPTQQLFNTTVPYLYVVTEGNPITLQCTHENTLLLVAGYLLKWHSGIPFPVEKPRPGLYPLTKHERKILEAQEATAEKEKHYDTLFVMMDQRIFFQVSFQPLLILSLLQGVLGYEIVHID